MACGIDPSHGSGSRLPALRECLRWAACQENGDDLIGRAIETVADPRNHTREPEKTQAVLDYLNTYLAPDGFEVVLVNGITTAIWLAGSKDEFAEFIAHG
jgi:hypothetical protein